MPAQLKIINGLKIMLNVQQDTIIQNFKKTLYDQKIPFHSIYLFGSRAKANIINITSDYDFLVLLYDIDNLEIIKKYKRKIILNVHKNIPGIQFDILVKTYSEFEKSKNIINTIFNEIYEKGIQL